jgi:aromatic-L-amino-acid/L-tryptophan decarboxylase
MTQSGVPADGPETARFESALARVGQALDMREATDLPDPQTVRAAWSFLADQPLPERGAGLDEVLRRLGDHLVPHGARVSEPGFWMFVTTGPTTAAVAAATAGHVAGTQRSLMHAFNSVEERSLHWLAELCGLPGEMRGLYSSGGSTANLVALGAARQHAGEARGLDLAADGLSGLDLVVYASTETHHTVQRAAGVLGIGRANVRVLPVGRDQRLDPDVLADAMDADLDAGRVPMAVVANAGSTNTGAIDPIRALGEVARARGVWFHVDGAYGLPGFLDERVRPRYDGLDLADSAIVDPHKWLGAPVGVAATFVRDRTLLQRAFTQGHADYLEGAFTEAVEVSVDSMGIPYSDFGVELSAPSRGVMVWAVVVDEGRAGLAQRISRDNDFAAFVARRGREHPRLESLTEPELSIACIRYAVAPANGIDELNARIYRRLVRETPYLPSTTIVNGAYAIRPCFINPRTTWDMVEGFVDTVVRIGDEEVASGPGRA